MIFSGVEMLSLAKSSFILASFTGDLSVPIQLSASYRRLKESLQRYPGEKPAISSQMKYLISIIKQKNLYQVHQAYIAVANNLDEFKGKEFLALFPVVSRIKLMEHFNIARAAMGGGGGTGPAPTEFSKYALDVAKTMHGYEGDDEISALKIASIFLSSEKLTMYFMTYPIHHNMELFDKLIYVTGGSDVNSITRFIDNHFYKTPFTYIYGSILYGIDKVSPTSHNLTPEDKILWTRLLSFDQTLTVEKIFNLKYIKELTSSLRDINKTTIALHKQREELIKHATSIYMKEAIDLIDELRAEELYSGYSKETLEGFIYQSFKSYLNENEFRIEHFISNITDIIKSIINGEVSTDSIMPDILITNKELYVLKSQSLSSCTNHDLRTYILEAYNKSLGNLYLTKMPNTDLRKLSIGLEIGNCMNLGSIYGSVVLKHTIMRPDSAIYAIYEGSNDAEMNLDEDKVVAVSWAYMAKNGELVFQWIDGKNSTYHDVATNFFRALFIDLQFRGFKVHLSMDTILSHGLINYSTISINTPALEYAKGYRGYNDDYQEDDCTMVIYRYKGTGGLVHPIAELVQQFQYDSFEFLFNEGKITDFISSVPGLMVYLSDMWISQISDFQGGCEASVLLKVFKNMGQQSLLNMHIYSLEMGHVNTAKFCKYYAGLEPDIEILKNAIKRGDAAIVESFFASGYHISDSETMSDLRSWILDAIKSDTIHTANKLITILVTNGLDLNMGLKDNIIKEVPLPGLVLLFKNGMTLSKADLNVAFIKEAWLSKVQILAQKLGAFVEAESYAISEITVEPPAHPPIIGKDGLELFAPVQAPTD